MEESYSIEQLKVPVVGEVLPGNGVGVVSEHQTCLDSKIHDHKSFGTQLVWKNFECVSDEKTRPSKGIEDAEHPDPNNLRVTG